MEDIKQTFKDIYNKNIWGEGDEPYFSGGGSHNRKMITPYIELLCELIRERKITTICDIGCGDFNIMRSVLQQSDFEKYYGIAVVDDLIEYNKEKFANDKISFSCMDASDDTQLIPEADLLIIRQVLQHLDNEHVKSILRRTERYHYVLITEHIPIIPWGGYNKDKPIDDGIRLKRGSGVYIEHKPFGYQCKHILNVYAGRMSRLRTSLICNRI